ncbi:hypothetical protein K435DRAFT_838731 [Dendrothele bispora CBS 962.96]|uniref:Uncharacterized protein n=1 Tax=Dendrothele bispora (strain CBS 962.96) TaxID=1314807 RepID=A0A4S8M5D7_DENBC|nr:hypothetical protein K435DRAFT_838731 [Dendrothele bispora CBS 962.96]
MPTGNRASKGHRDRNNAVWIVYRGKKYGMTLRMFMSACRPRKTSWERSMTVAPSKDGLQEGIRPYAWVQASAAASCSVGSELVKTGQGIEEKKYGMTLRVFMSACRPRKTSWERSMTVAPSKDGLQEGIRPYAWVQLSAAASCSVGSELVKTGQGIEEK